MDIPPNPNCGRGLEHPALADGPVSVMGRLAAARERETLGLGPEATVLAILTEAPTS